MSAAGQENADTAADYIKWIIAQLTLFCFISEIVQGSKLLKPEKWHTCFDSDGKCCYFLYTTDKCTPCFAMRQMMNKSCPFEAIHAMHTYQFFCVTALPKEIGNYAITYSHHTVLLHGKI
ncbi:hypothetical protein ABZP36_015060 [Zizania latifolia]